MSEKFNTADHLAKALDYKFTQNPNKVDNQAPGSAWPVVKGLWYNKQVIKLDGWHFENCRFDNCLLIAESQFFSIKNCYIDKSNNIDVRPALRGVVQLGNFASHLQGQPIAAPTWSSDGTVSFGIGGGNGL
ncbi:hypothetical protein [Pseudomonas alabamensis]|uniref:hypothetical protein n=1 Tax=Pseudomonas alabamensis TaxID=3064349 RepID=UPI003F6545A2